MPRFLLLARDDNTAWAGISPADAEAVIGRYIAWGQKLKSAGHLVSSDKLRDQEGRVLARKDKRLVATDGPYAEVKEIVGGFWILEAADYAAAEKLLTDCPHLDFGTLELRQIEDLG